MGAWGGGSLSMIFNFDITVVALIESQRIVCQWSKSKKVRAIANVRQLMLMVVVVVVVSNDNSIPNVGIE